MRKKSLIISTTLLLSFFLLFTLHSVLAGEKSLKKKGYLGVSIEELNRHTKKELKVDFGVVISRVEIDSPADEYGLTEDDVIQEVNGVKIRRPHTLTRIVRKIKPGDKAKIAIVRDGGKKTISVVIGKMKKINNFSYSFSGPQKEKIFTFINKGDAYLGVQLRELNEDLAPYFGVKPEQGALIMEVEEDSPAQKVGLKSGDVITKIESEKISDPDDVQEIISDCEEDDEIELTIVRKNKKQTFKVILEERRGGGNVLFGPHKKLKEIRIGPDKKLLELHDEDIHIKREKPNIKIEKKKKIKIIDDTV